MTAGVTRDQKVGAPTTAARRGLMMRFGAYLPTYWDDYGTSPIHVAIEGAALAAEALGYEGVWANDTVIIPAANRGTPGYEQVIEPLVTLASLVHLVPRLTLGIAVLVLPQRNTIVVAKQAAALHLLSQQRLILGVGIGWRAEEFALLGANYADRAAVTDEAIEVLQTLWCEPTARYHGQFHHFDEVSMPPHPTDGGPPIWIGGNGPRIIRQAAKYGSGWLPFVMDLDAFRSGVSTLRELTRERQSPTIGNVFYYRITKPDEPAVVHSTTPGMPTPFSGGPDAIARNLELYRQAGLEYALCAFESEDLDDLLRQMRTFAEQVAPQFKEAG
jgi:probable F420-dependent oxidoreductase